MPSELLRVFVRRLRDGIEGTEKRRATDDVRFAIDANDRQRKGICDRRDE